jgi:hypothetical protein
MLGILVVLCGANLALGQQLTVLKGVWKDAFNYHEAQINAEGDTAWANAPAKSSSYVIVEADYEPNLAYDSRTDTDRWDKTGTLTLNVVYAVAYGSRTYFDEATGKKKTAKYAEDLVLAIGDAYQVGRVFAADLSGQAGVIKAKVEEVKVYPDAEDPTYFEYEYRVSLSGIDVFLASGAGGDAGDEIVSGKGAYRPEKALTKLANGPDAEVGVEAKIEQILVKGGYLRE